MKLTVLIDNNTLIDRYFLGEPALSFYIETEGKRILFDTGYSDAYLSNAQKMGINLLNTDTVVISHGHIDHTWGLLGLIRLFTETNFERAAASEAPTTHRPELLAHPLALKTKTFQDLALYEIGSVFSEDKLRQQFELRLSREPVWITERLVFLGEIPRRNDFEAQHPIGESGQEADYLLDDTALAYKTNGGLVIIAGCSHAGICNTAAYAQEVCGEERVADIIGGFHLLNPPRQQLDGTLAYLKNLQPLAVHACHCTDLASKIALASVVNIQEVGTGLQLAY